MTSPDRSGLTTTIEDEDGGLITKWILVAEVADTDGGQSIRVTASENLSTWDGLGLLTYATTMQGDDE